MALKFVEESELQKVDMGDGDWVQIPARLSFGFVSKFEETINGNDKGQVAAFLVQFIKGWSAKGADGEMLPVTEENILRMDVANFKQITEAIAPLMTLEKKS